MSFWCGKGPSFLVVSIGTHPSFVAMTILFILLTYMLMINPQRTLIFDEILGKEGCPLALCLILIMGEVLNEITWSREPWPMGNLKESFCSMLMTCPLLWTTMRKQHNIIQIQSNVQRNWKYFMEYSPYSRWMWGIFCIILSIQLNIV